jgi:hypothetical protein
MLERRRRCAMADFRYLAGLLVAVAMLLAALFI